MTAKRVKWLDRLTDIMVENAKAERWGQNEILLGSLSGKQQEHLAIHLGADPSEAIGSHPIDLHKTIFAAVEEEARGTNPATKDDPFTLAYIEAALWSSTDEEDVPLDENYGPSDIAPATLRKMRADAAKFQRENEGDIDDSERAGHDFWLTRNEHGAGFWDGDWPEPAATRLTEASHGFGRYDLYVGDDGRIHGSAG